MFLLKNFVWSTLAAEADDLQTTFELEDTSRIPSILPGQILVMALHDGVQDSELVNAIGFSGNVLTVERGKEDTPPRVWPAGTKVFATFSAAMLDATVGASVVLQEQIDDLVTKDTDLDAMDATLQSQITSLGASTQPLDAFLTSIAGLSPVADQMIYTTAADVAALTTQTAYARTLIAAIDAAAARAILALGSMATQANTAVNIDGGTIDGATIEGCTIQQATETVRGALEVATTTEVAAEASNTVAITPDNIGMRAKFHAHRNGTAQTATSATVLQWAPTTVPINVGGYYDNTLDRWTPPAGYTCMHFQALFDATNGVDAEPLQTYIYKNGSVFAQTIVRRSGAAAQSVVLSALDLANGTDFYDFRFNKSGAGNGNIDGVAVTSFAIGFMV